MSVGNKSLASYTYGSSNGQLQQTSYGNGDSVSYSYDNLERVSQVYYNGSSTAALEYSYTGAGTLGALKDNASNRTYSYTYDSLNRLTSMTEYVGSTGVQQYRAGYDDANRVTKVQYKLSPAWNGTFGSTRTYTYTYNSGDGSLSAMSLPSGAYAYSYDGLKRLSSRVLTVNGSTLINRQLGYLAGAGAGGTTLLVSSLTNKNASGGTISQYNYTYDALGNITAISGSTNATYTYDNQSQLLTETVGDTTWTYTYDSYGNLRSKTDGTTTDTYTYGDGQWLDLLTAYNGNTISYDAIGNPTTWYDGTTFTWANGRRLASATNTDENLTVSYTYDRDGLRLTKTVGGVEHKYLWQGSKLVSEYYDGKELEFFYDESGNPCAFSYKSSSTATPVTYYYLTNLQGDIVGILDSSGTSVAAYTYNAWGKLLSSSGSMADVNPLRYRGYYYDAETGLYYLQSRYYDPEIGRWINADSYTSTGQGIIGNNMFVYCLNNPVALIDSSGELAIATLILIGSAILGASATAYTAYEMRKAGEDWADTIFYSVGAGICVFGTVYTLGMSAYSLYCSLSLYYGYTPVTEIGSNPKASIPQEAYDTYDFVSTHNGSPKQDYKGGAIFANDGRDNSAVLPNSYAPFREYDIYPKVPGVGRGTERIVIGQGAGGAVWYTADHYRTFVRMDR